MIRAETAERSNGGADDGAGFAIPRALPVGTRTDIQGVLQDAGDGAIIFGRHEEHGVGGFDPFAKLDERGRRALIEVLVVVRQVTDLDELELNARAVVGTAIEFARSSPLPQPSQALERMFA